MDSTRYSVERRCELLAMARVDDLLPLADRCLSEVTDFHIVAGPEVGMVMIQVREPVADERFFLAEALVTRAEVELDGARGWSMRLGDDRTAALAAAICDAAVEGDSPRAADIEQLCTETEATLLRQGDLEWAELAPTRVSFEELDR